ELGILIRRGEALETAQSIDTVVLDKTGTITRGLPEVTGTIPLNGYSEQELLRMAAGAERYSEHALAAAVTRYARGMGIADEESSGFRASAGSGVFARVRGRGVLVGSPKFLRDRQVDLVTAHAAMERIAGMGATPVMVAVDGAPAGAIAVADTVKPDSEPAI